MEGDGGTTRTYRFRKSHGGLIMMVADGGTGTACSSHVNQTRRTPPVFVPLCTTPSSGTWTRHFFFSFHHHHPSTCSPSLGHPSKAFVSIIFVQGVPSSTPVRHYQADTARLRRGHTAQCRVTWCQVRNRCINALFSLVYTSLTYSTE